ncbi:MAG: hypothetical protein KAJ73_02315 [Zetaproteobacteria bacterium]|nr:hypothetical protein [Zetaproteobacteria bacterium]
MRDYLIWKYLEVESDRLAEFLLDLAFFPQGKPMLWGIITGVLAALCVFSMVLVLGSC